MDYKDILCTYAEYFEQSDVASNVMRWIGWKIIKLLHGICDLCQGLWEAVFQTLDFTQVFAAKVGEYYPIWYALFVVSIMAAGTIFLFSEHRPPILKNLIITTAVVMLLPGGVRLGAQLLQIEQTAFMSDGNSVADTTVISNVTDLLYQKNNGWNFLSPNCLSGETVNYIDPNEQVEKKTDKVFKYYIVVDASSGQVSYKEIKKGFFGLLTPLYYRYSIHFMAIIGELIVNSLVLIFASYRLFRLIWDMIYGEILAYILSGDVVSGEKTKQVLQYLLNLFWSISIMIWGFVIWREFEIWVASQYGNNFIRVLLIAFGGIAMIDGPDIVERVCGIDVGMKDGMMKTMGAMHLMQSGLEAARKGGELAKTAAGAAKKAGNSMLNPGGKAQQNRMQTATGNGVNTQQPPGGVGNPGGSAATVGRKEPPGGAQQAEQAGQKPEGGASSQTSGTNSKFSGMRKSQSSGAASASSTGIESFANNSGGAITSDGQTGNTASFVNSASDGNAAMLGSIVSGPTGMQAQAQKNGQSSPAESGKKPEQKADSSGRTGKEPLGGISKKQANGQTDSSTVGQDRLSDFARENDEPTIQSESMADVSSGSAEPEGGVSSMAADTKQQEAAPIMNASERVRIGHTASVNAVPQGTKERKHNASTQSTLPSGSHTQTKNRSNNHEKQVIQKTVTSKLGSSERVRIGHRDGIEPPTRTEKSDND